MCKVVSPPVLHGVVHYYRGKEILFHYGLFMDHFSLRTRDPHNSAPTLLNASSVVVKKGLLLVWASTGCRSDVGRGSDGFGGLVHGDDRALLSWRRA